MANILSPKLTADLAELVQRVVKELELNDFQIWASPDGKSLHFKKSYHTATLLTDLVKEGRWPDIRHIFRASIQPGPQLTNQWADDNEWARAWR